jgi:hypothetical protein
VICHHAFSNVPPSKPKAAGMPFPLASGLLGAFFGKFPLPLARADVDKLVARCGAYDVRAVLTGHTHFFHQERFENPSDSTQFVWELRCSTTLQDPVQGARREFIVHEIRLDDGAPQPVWEYTRYSSVVGKFEARDVKETVD